MSHTVPVRTAQAMDIPALEAVIRDCGLFTPEEADGFASSLQGHLEAEADGTGEGRVWLLGGDSAGAAYLSPEPGPGVWNLLFLGVRPEVRRQGVARALTAEVEQPLRAEGARMLLIDTSTEPPQAAARALYEALGYVRVTLIPDYCGPGDGKLTVRRMLELPPDLEAAGLNVRPVLLGLRTGMTQRGLRSTRRARTCCRRLAPMSAHR